MGAGTTPDLEIWGRHGGRLGSTYDSQDWRLGRGEVIVVNWTIMSSAWNLVIYLDGSGLQGDSVAVLWHQ